MERDSSMAWSRWQWVGEGQGTNRSMRDDAEVHWHRGQWVGAGLSRNVSWPAEADGGDTALSGGGRNPGGNGWARVDRGGAPMAVTRSTPSTSALRGDVRF